MGEQVCRTFLFTDIERSTELWESAPESMRVSLERHNQIIDQAIVLEGGQLFKRIGDATCSTFDSPAKAANAQRSAAKKTLLKRLSKQATTGTRNWKRDELYES